MPSVSIAGETRHPGTDQIDFFARWTVAGLGGELLGPLLSGHSLMVIVDYYSRYYKVERLKSTTAEKVIHRPGDVFSRYGLPIVKSDNGPQFKSEEFRDFCALNGINHIRVTAKWAQANWEVERQDSSLLKRLQLARAQRLD